MKEKEKKEKEEEPLVQKDAKGDSIPREYETMSQQQNRHGEGREQNGSDGSKAERGSNH